MQSLSQLLLRGLLATTHHLLRDSTFHSLFPEQAARPLFGNLFFYQGTHAPCEARQATIGSGHQGFNFAPQ